VQQTSGAGLLARGPVHFAVSWAASSMYNNIEPVLRHKSEPCTTIISWKGGDAVPDYRKRREQGWLVRPAQLEYESRTNDGKGVPS
jgi:hypothetical protein